MKQKLKIAITFMLYRAEVSNVRHLKDGGSRFKFLMYPRTFIILFLLLLVSPLFIIYFGVANLIDVFKETNKVQSWSSYEITTDGREPSKIEMYRKF